MASVSTVQCTRCGAAGHVAAQCPNKSFMRPLCTKCNRMGHTADRCPQEARAKAAQVKAAREVEQDAMTCFKCGLQGHSRASCPWTDKEASELRRAARQATMTCFKCGQVGHTRGECPSNASDICSVVSEMSENVSEASKDASSTVATSVDLPSAKPEPRICSFCGATQTQVRARKGVKVCRDRCQSCWRSISGKDAK